MLRHHGAPGCAGRVAPQSLTLLLGGGGAVGVGLAVPNAPSLVGLRFYSQALVLDAAANSLGAVVSDAAAARIGS